MALSVGADDEHLAGGVDDVGVEGVELVDLHDACDLGHESFDESEVAAGDPDDGADGLDVVGVAWVEQQAELVPVVRQDEREVVGVERLVDWWAKPIRLYSCG